MPTVMISLPGTKPTEYIAYRVTTHPEFKHVDFVPQNDFAILRLNREVKNFQVQLLISEISKISPDLGTIQYSRTLMGDKEIIREKGYFKFGRLGAKIHQGDREG